MRFNTVNLTLNIGKDSDSSVVNGLPHNVMMTLISGLEGKGYCVKKFLKCKKVGTTKK